MNRRSFLKKFTYFTSTLTMANSTLGSEGPLSKRLAKLLDKGTSPNIIFIFIDDLGWTDLSFMGSDYYETPNIDKLASQGMVFTNAYANAATCAPSRACLLTGQYAPRHGIYTTGDSARGFDKDRRLIPIENTTTLALEHITIAEVLKEAGYVNASIGKWHMGNPPNYGPNEQGFHVNVGGFSIGGPPGGYFVPYNNPYIPDGSSGEYLTDRLTDEAIKFIENNRENPLCLYLTHYAVHVPIQAKSGLVSKYESKLGSNGHDSPTYAAMIDSVDQGVGRIMDKLDELQLADNTIVIFFSDNGGSCITTDMIPLRGSKGMFYEGGIRVPMICRWPGIVKGGTQCDVPVIGTDFFPTILELADTIKPSGLILDGESIVPLLMGENSMLRDAIYWHFPAYLEINNQGGINEARDPLFRTRPVSVIRKGDWKLLLFYEEWILDGGRDFMNVNNAVELYNLVEDIGESNNLALVNTDKRDELLDDLFAWLEATNAPIPTEPNPNYTFVEHSKQKPLSYKLEQNYPNPFNSETTIRFQLPQNSDVSLHINNLHGQLVRKLVSEEKQAGYHEVIWDAQDTDGRIVPSGVYLYQIRAGNFTEVKKLMLLK